MIQVLRLSGLAVIASILVAVVVVSVFFVVSFFIAEWRPDWTIAESIGRWLEAGSRPPETRQTGLSVSTWDTLWPWLTAPLAPLAWYLVVWWGWGRDRLLGVAFPRFAPPAGLSPSGVRQILGMGFDGKVMAAEMLNLAVNGYLRIERDPAGRYTLRRTGSSSGALTASQRRLLASLFRARPWVRLSGEDAAHLRVAMETFRDALEDELEGPVYATNVWAVGIGIAVSGGAIIAAMERLPHAMPAELDLWLAGGALIAVAAVNVLFFRLMKAPTELGREILDAIGGFRRFLATAEHERMKMADAPRMTSHLFARFLPYALAMDIELDWSERFADSLKRAIPDALDFDWYADPARASYDMGLTGMVRTLGGAVAAVLREPDTTA
ncbi:MAG: DUF2207 domain-containing protein [Rhodospirillales bacterium]|nr:MAG: DUF2207 domain-containing protein [Rhodospirillales bacterium]